MNARTKRIALSDEIHEMLTKPITGDGGHQRLARRLYDRIISVGESHYVAVDDVIVERLRRYAWQYGEGGWQNRWRALLDEYDRLFPAASALAEERHNNDGEVGTKAA